MCGLSYWLLAAGGGSLGGWSRCDVMVVDDGKQGSREAGDCWAGTSDAPRVAAAPSCHRNPFTYYRYTTYSLIQSLCGVHTTGTHLYFCTPILSLVIFLVLPEENLHHY